MRTVEGNILEAAKAPAVIVQQVNCLGVMGAGLAKQIATKWPVVKLHYTNLCRGFEAHSPELMGEVQFVEVSESVYVANLFGQNGYGRGQCFTDYTVYPRALKSLLQAPVQSPQVYIPYGLGCGLAGGDWSVMEPLLEKYCPDAILVKYSPDA